MGQARVPMRWVGAGIGGDDCTGTGRQSHLVMRGTDPGMLCCVRLVCNQGMSLSAHSSEEQNFDLAKLIFIRVRYVHADPINFIS